MKVESKNDVQANQRLDQPVLNPATVAMPTKAADELSFLFSQEVDANSRPLSERKMGFPIPPVEHMVQLYDQLGHPAQATMAAISRRVRMLLLQKPTVEKLLELTGRDPARAFVVLKYVAAHADSEARPAEAALARDAINRLEIRFKGEIQAGLNIASALQTASIDPQERQALRTLYYASVVARQSLATMMQALLGVYGGERFHDGLKIMRKALADDIAALVSSSPTAVLRTLLLGLQSCGQLSGVLAGCRALIERLGVGHDAVELLQRLLGYAGSGIDAGEFLRLGTDLGGGSIAQKLVVLNAFYPLLQQMPLALWGDSQTRRETLHMLLLVIDELDRSVRGPKRFAGEPRAAT
ncbi:MULTISPECIES: TyeA family type III secretion system gatekeeper subunit [Pseudomonas]|jgi:type III secretion protein W|uniref:TyeA family type III secretion system gatekeeper subunit n=1 Tax=Pseudomonas rhodesiae TaxID=76760 RepID=A0A8I1E8T6_9PSED|nr:MULTISPECIES: TyeA family type III secretion system gatekeeper subunit [Pseudomonas]MBB4815681.1 type III secretion protein W [Pseudomonas rhodesiae]MBI6602136.1 TyeA family type III secretion system gatekeeper subunit [Pseudomonas sp. S4_EA_1b]MBI6627353.1 TyeA family type III secretion system gatekeeper subunit [Pseudomonas rhodesiae]MBX4136782.1 TyeA family type III secretion system gatekeeper subunit [Pseudomonas sp. S5F11]NMY81701.1 TyeA family type III secretion system gatekeeper subu